jgi:hypothetical protein
VAVAVTTAVAVAVAVAFIKTTHLVSHLVGLLLLALARVAMQ